MKVLLNSITAILFCIFCFNASASNLQVDVKTPQGALIKLDIYNSGSHSVLLLAPGQGCNPRLDMYDTIATEAKANGFTVVRLYWAYCISDPQNGNPSDDLSKEKQDFLTALEYTRNDLKFSDSNIFVGGKSLGTLVSSEIFVAQKSLQALLLLTALCTDSQTDPKIRKNVFEENYPGVSSETRTVLLAQGNVDPLCDNNHFQEFLKNKANNFVPLVVHGNHSLGIQNPDGQYNVELGAKNLQVISKWIFSWLK